ncbi:MAG: YybS family protein [Treponema sp.]|nr:YybS family protein [Treponema sp.]
MVTAKSSYTTAWIPALIGAAASLFLIRSGFAVLLFLLPLGFVGFGWGPKTLWTGLVFAVLGNFLITLFFGLTFNVPGEDMFWDMLYFTAAAASFAWIILPADQKSYRIPGAYRLVLGASLCTLVFVGLFTRIFNNPAFYDSVKSQVETIAAFYWSGNTAETQKALLDALDVDKIIEVMKNMILRGGALFSSLLILFVNRQLSLFLIRFFGAPRKNPVFRSFHVHPRIIWVLSFSLLLLLLSRNFFMTAAEIILWNIIVLCALMYLAQGFGIVGYFMQRPGFPPVLRFFLPVVFVLLLFSPVINAVMLGIVAVLGVAENWVTFRIVNLNGPPATPQA